MAFYELKVTENLFFVVLFVLPNLLKTAYGVVVMADWESQIYCVKLIYATVWEHK